MKNLLNIRPIVLLSAIFIIVLSLDSHVLAQSSQTRPIIGVLDTENIERESLAAKGVRLERDKYLARYQATVRELETELREEEQRLTQQRNVLAPEVFQQQAEAFQAKFTNAQQDMRIKQQNLNTVFQRSIIEIRQEMLKISSKVAQDRGINMVMPQNALLLSDPSMDITRQVLEILNERLPSVEMQNPEGDADSAEVDNSDN